MKSRWHQLVGWMVIALLTALYANRQVAEFLIHPELMHCNDFKHLYLGAAFLREGGNPYEAEEFRRAAGAMASQDPRFRTILPFVYLPFTGIVLIPLTWLPFDRAVWVWFWLNQLMALGGAWLAARAIGLPRRAGVLALVLFLLTWNQPLSRTLSAGQMNAALLFLYALILWMTPRAPAWATGAVSAFAALFKITPAIFFFWFLIERRFRTALWMAVFTVIYLLAGGPFAGIRTHLAFLPLLREMGYGRSTWSQYNQRFYRDPYNQSLNSFYHHTSVVDPSGAIRPWVKMSPGAANSFTLLDTLVLIAATAFLVWPRKKRPPRTDQSKPESSPESSPESPSESPSGSPSESPPLAPILRFSLLLVLSLLIPSILWDHYLLALIIAHLAMARVFLEFRIGIIPLLLLAATIVINGAIIQFDAPEYQSGLGLIVMSAKLWTTLATWGLLAWALTGLRAERDLELLHESS